MLKMIVSMWFINFADDFWDFNSTEFHLPLKMLPPAPLNLFSVTVV